MILFRLTFCRFSTEAYTSTLRCCSGQNWTKRVHKMRQQTTPNWAFALHLQTATAPHKQLQPAKLRDAPDGVYEGVRCARQQSEVARNDSRDIFVDSKLRLRSTKNSLHRKTSSFHAREPICCDGYITYEKAAFTKCLLLSRRMLHLFLERSRTPTEEKIASPWELVRQMAQKRPNEG